VNKVISTMAISRELVDPKRGVKYFEKERDWGFGLVRCLESAKGKQVKIPVLDSACGAICAPFGICLWQHKRTSSQEKEAAAEISFLFKKVKRGVGQPRQRGSSPPLKGVVN